MKILKVAVASAASFSLAGCATLVRGTKTSYEITSVPPDADVTLSSGERCVTPCKIKLRRSDAFTATVEKAGYTPAVASVRSKLSGGGSVAAAGNILAGGIIGGIVDGRNGSMNSFYPGKLNVALEPQRDQTVTPPERSERDAAGANPQ
jgi:hypothetical protein